MRDMWRSIAHTGGAKFYNLIVGIAFLSLTARWLGPEGRGQFAASLAWVTLFATMGHLSLGQVALHRASARKGLPWLGETLGSLLLLAVIISVLGWALAAGVYFVANGRAYGALPTLPLVIAFAGLPLYIWEQYGSSLLISLDRVGIYNRYQMIGRTVGVVALLGLIFLARGGVASAVAAALFGQLVVAAGGIRFLVGQSAGAIRPSKEAIVELLRGGAKLHLNAVGTFVFGSIDILILNSFRGSNEAGFYQLAVQLIAVIMILPQAVALVLYGRVVKMGPEAAWPHHRKILLQTEGIVILGGVIAAGLAPKVVAMVAGEAFLPSVEVFRWLLLAAVGMTCSIIMVPQWIGRGLFWQAAVITLLIGAAATISNLVMVPVYGLRGAAWSAVGAYTLSLVCNIWMIFICNRGKEAQLKPS